MIKEQTYYGFNPLGDFFMRNLALDAIEGWTHGEPTNHKNGNGAKMSERQPKKREDAAFLGVSSQPRSDQGLLDHMRSMNNDPVYRQKYIRTEAELQNERQERRAVVGGSSDEPFYHTEVLERMKQNEAKMQANTAAGTFQTPGQIFTGGATVGGMDAVRGETIPFPQGKTKTGTQELPKKPLSRRHVNLSEAFQSAVWGTLLGLGYKGTEFFGLLPPIQAPTAPAVPAEAVPQNPEVISPNLTPNPAKPTSESTPEVGSTATSILDVERQIIDPKTVELPASVGGEVMYVENLGGDKKIIVVNNNNSVYGNMVATENGTLFGTPEGRELFFGAEAQAFGYEDKDVFFKALQDGTLGPLEFGEIWGENLPDDFKPSGDVILVIDKIPDFLKSYVYIDGDSMLTTLQKTDGWLVDTKSSGTDNRPWLFYKIEATEDGAFVIRLGSSGKSGFLAQFDNSSYAKQIEMVRMLVKGMLIFNETMNNKGYPQTTRPSYEGGQAAIVVNGKVFSLDDILDYYSKKGTVQLPEDFVPASNK